MTAGKPSPLQSQGLRTVEPLKSYSKVPERLLMTLASTTSVPAQLTSSIPKAR